ncbi:MAG: hypothetical protein HYV29_01635 [Ignavibacteriales bacterium]|nr:hypothetical protein [Ignavibacteriales bacterium]
MERPVTPLLIKMQDSGFSLKMLADEINAHFPLGITKPDVSNFVNLKFKSISRKKRNLIRLFFIAHRWLPIPKPKNIPVCKNCGVHFPTGRAKNKLTVRKIQTLITRNNHKRTTKVSQ